MEIAAIVEAILTIQNSICASQRATLPSLSLRQFPNEKRAVSNKVLLLIASWDAHLFAHSEQVARDLLWLAPRDQAEEWYWAGLLHDVGKITLSPALLRKRGALTLAEWRVMRQHALRGAIVLRGLGVPRTIVESAQFHHERWDGTGYPQEMRGDQIPRIARAVAVADAYTAMTLERPYRRTLSHAQAREEIARNAGTQFDPEIAQRFLSVSSLCDIDKREFPVLTRFQNWKEVLQ